jgi:hypothetical protein
MITPIDKINIISFLVHRYLDIFKVKTNHLMLETLTLDGY